MAKRKSKAGRPTLFDQRKAKALVALLKQGVFRKQAAVSVGIGERTLREWMRAGKADPEGPFGDFRRMVMEAEAAAEIAAVKSAHKGALKDPELALKYLAVRWRKRWNPKQTVEVTGKEGKPVEVATTVSGTVEHTHDVPEPSKLAQVLDVLRSVGALAPTGEAAGAGEGADAEADEVHPAQAAPEAAGVPPRPE